MILLLLEDDLRVARGIVRVTGTLGHQALHAVDLAGAKAALAAHHVDVVIADLWLAKGESGLDFLHWARDHHSTAKRVLTSGALPPQDPADPPVHEAFLPKPFGRMELSLLLGDRS